MTKYRRSAVSTTALAVCVSVSYQPGEVVAEPSTRPIVDAAPSSGVTSRDARTAFRPPGATRELSGSRTSEARYVAAAPHEHDASSASPPFPYRYVGRVEVEGRLTVHLAKDDKLYPVKVGDVLDGGYRVDTIKSDGLEVTYLVQKRRQFVAFSKIAAPDPTRSSIATRPEASPGEPPTSTLPGQSVAPGLPSSAESTVSEPPVAGSGGTAPIAGVPPAPSGGPSTVTPPVGAAPAAPPSATTAQPLAGAAAMPMSRPTTEMPVEAPTVSQMPTFPPGMELPATGSTMAAPPPADGR
jgi:hypothetical protein